MSLLERQKWGGKDWRYRCSDFSICSYVVTVYGRDGLGEGGLDGWEEPNK